MQIEDLSVGQLRGAWIELEQKNKEYVNVLTIMLDRKAIVAEMYKRKEAL